MPAGDSIVAERVVLTMLDSAFVEVKALPGSTVPKEAYEIPMSSIEGITWDRPRSEDLTCGWSTAPYPEMPSAVHERKKPGRPAKAPAA